MTIPDAARPSPVKPIDAKVSQIDPKTGLPSVNALGQQEGLRSYINGAGRIIPCSASTTTNVVTLTPNDASPLLEKYVFGDVFVFWADATTSGSVTAKVVANPGQAGSAPLATLKVYTAANGSQAGSGSVQDDGLCALYYVPTLDSNAGGFVLQVIGGGGNPATVAAGALSNQATLDIAVGSSYDMYEIELISVVPVTDSQSLLMRVSQGGVFLTGASDYFYDGITAGVTGPDEAQDFIVVSGGTVGNGAAEGVTVTVKVFRPGASSFQKLFTWFGFARSTTPTSRGINGGGGLAANTDAIDGVRFFFTNNINTGYYAVRGYRFT